MKYTITLLLSNLLLTPSLVDCWLFEPKYLSRTGFGYHRRGYEALEVKNPTYQDLKDHKVSIVRRTNLENLEEEKYVALATEPNKMKYNTEDAKFKSNAGNKESDQLSEANFKPIKLVGTRSDLEDSLTDIDANEVIIRNKNDNINSKNSNSGNESLSQSIAELSTQNLINSEDNNSYVQKLVISRAEPIQANLENSEDKVSTSMIDNSSLDNNNKNNNTDGSLIRHRNDGYLELSNNQNNQTSNNFDSETNKLSDNINGDGPGISRVQPLPIDLEAPEGKKLALKSTGSAAMDNFSTNSVNSSTKDKIRIVDRAETNNSQNNVNNSTDGKTNNLDEDLLDVEFKNEFNNYESLRKGYWSVM
jgi:hypothetical protein